MTDERRISQSSDVTPRASPANLDLSAIFAEHFDYVWHTLQRLGVRDADLEDFSHEVFLKVHARLESYDPSRPLRPWLFGFAYRVAADYRRLARHRVEVIGASVEAIDPVRPADQRIEDAEERGLVLAALATIDLGRRAVLLMHDADEIPIPEVARELGIPVNTAYSRLRIGRDELSSAIKILRRRRKAS